MSRWKDEFEKHPIHAALSQVHACLDVKDLALEQEAHSEYRRFRKIINHLDSGLEAVDPEVAPIDLLNNISSNISNASFVQNLKNFARSPNAKSLVAANNHLSAVANPIRSLASSANDNGNSARLSSIEQTVDVVVATLSKESKEFSEKLRNQSAKLVRLNELKDAMEKAFAEFTISLQKDATDWQKQFTADQSKRAKQFSDRQINQGESYSTWLQEIKQEKEGAFKKSYLEWEAANDVFVNAFEAKLDSVQLDAEKRHKLILDMHGLVAEDSVAGGYTRQANHERDQANKWRTFSILFLFITVLWIGFTYWNLTEITTLEGVITISFASELNWVQGLKAASLTAVLLYMAVFASRQSSQHRVNERKTRWFALEVKAIGPFIENLPDASQVQLKEKLAERLFAQEVGYSGDPDGDVKIDPSVIKLVIGMFKDIAKSLK